MARTETIMCFFGVDGVGRSIIYGHTDRAMLRRCVFAPLLCTEITNMKICYCVCRIDNLSLNGGHAIAYENNRTQRMPERMEYDLCISLTIDTGDPKPRWDRNSLYRWCILEPKPEPILQSQHTRTSETKIVFICIYMRLDPPRAIDLLSVLFGSLNVLILFDCTFIFLGIE